MATAIVRLNGGLGNQLYQYSFGKYLESIGYLVFFDKYPLQKSKVIHERLLIEQFFDDIKYLRTYESRIYWILGKIGLIRLIKERVRCDDRDFENLSVSRLTIFSGYWQNICYHDVDRLNLRLANNNPIQIPYAVIHVRRGDYVGHQSIKCLDSDYYNFMIETIERRHKLPIYIVTDDYEWVEENLLCDGCVVISGNFLDDWLLMYNSSILAIANSSFSLWAALLGKIQLVYQPQYWLNDKSTTKWGRSDWIIVDNELLQIVENID